MEDTNPAVAAVPAKNIKPKASSISLKGSSTSPATATASPIAPTPHRARPGDGTSLSAGDPRVSTTAETDTRAPKQEDEQFETWGLGTDAEEEPESEPNTQGRRSELGASGQRIAGVTLDDSIAKNADSTRHSRINNSRNTITLHRPKATPSHGNPSNRSPSNSPATPAKSSTTPSSTSSASPVFSGSTSSSPSSSSSTNSSSAQVRPYYRRQPVSSGNRAISPAASAQQLAYSTTVINGQPYLLISPAPLSSDFVQLIPPTSPATAASIGGVTSTAVGSVGGVGPPFSARKRKNQGNELSGDESGSSSSGGSSGEPWSKVAREGKLSSATSASPGSSGLRLASLARAASSLNEGAGRQQVKREGSPVLNYSDKGDEDDEEEDPRRLFNYSASAWSSFEIPRRATGNEQTEELLALLKQLEPRELVRPAEGVRIFYTANIVYETKSLLFWRKGKKSQNDVSLTMRSSFDLSSLGTIVYCDAFCNGKPLDRKSANFSIARTSGVGGAFQYVAMFKGILPELLSTKTMIELQFYIPLPAGAVAADQSKTSPSSPTSSSSASASPTGIDLLVSDKQPLVIYNHAKYKPCCQCMLAWYGPDSLTIDKPTTAGELIVKLAHYYNDTLMQPGMPKWLADYLLKRLAVSEDTSIEFQYFYEHLGEWFSIALDMASEHYDFFWKKQELSTRGSQPSDANISERYIPLLVSRNEAIDLLKATHAVVGDFVIRVCSTVAEKQIRQARPKLKYPYIITVVGEEGKYLCISVKEREMLWPDFIHGKELFKRYVLFKYDGGFEKIDKDKFAFNPVQAERLKETSGQTSVVLLPKRGVSQTD